MVLHWSSDRAVLAVCVSGARFGVCSSDKKPYAIDWWLKSTCVVPKEPGGLREVKQDFDDLVFRSIDETLAEALGVTIRDAIYFKEGRRSEELSSHIKSLSSVLEKTLGPGLTRTIFLIIAKRLYSELHIAFAEERNFDLVDYVEEAKKRT